MPPESTDDRNPSQRERSETEAAISENAEAIAAFGKRVIHIGGRPATEPLIGLARIEPTHCVLDAGFGVGSTAVELATRFGGLVTAVDISPALVERATANARAAGVEDEVTVRRGDILGLDFPDDTFDRVIVEAVTMFLDRAALRASWSGSVGPAVTSWTKRHASLERRRKRLAKATSVSSPGSTSTRNPRSGRSGIGRPA